MTLSSNLFLSLPLPLPQQQHRIQHQGGLSAGGGISAQAAADGALPGFIGSASFSQRNLFGLGQKLAATLEVGQVDKLFRINHSDPWILGDPFRTSRVCSLQNTRSSGAPIYGAATLEEEEYFGGGGGGGNGGGGNGGDFLSPSSSSSYFPSDSNAGALDPSGQYAGSPSRSTAAVAAANAADAESPIIISRLTGESRVFSRFFSFFTSFSTQRETKKLTLFSLLSLLSLSLLLSSTSIIQTRRRRVLPPALRGLDGNPGTRLAARLGRRREGADAGHGCVRRSLDADGRRHGRRHARDGAAPRELRRGQRRGPAFAGAGAPPEAFVAQLQQGQGQGREEGEPGRGGLAVAARVGDRPRRCACLFFSSFL